MRILDLFRRKKPLPAKAEEPAIPETTRDVIIGMVANGASMEELLLLYPDLGEAAIRKVIKSAVGKLPPFPD